MTPSCTAPGGFPQQAVSRAANVGNCHGGRRFGGASDAQVRHEHWPASRMCHSAETSKNVAKATVLYGLDVLAKVVGDSICEQVDIFVKPKKKVVSKLDTPRGELVILPEGNVRVLDEGEKIPPGYFEIVCQDSPPGLVPCVVPSTSDTAVSPWCFVEPKQLASQANMVLMFFRSR